VRWYSRLSKSAPDLFNFHPRSFILPLQAELLQAHMAAIEKKSDRTIIIKPDRGCQGRGIQLTQNPTDIANYTSSAVAQAYLPPLLLGDKKFDLRIYVLITSCDPLRVYIYREGMVRFCTDAYQQPRAGNLDQPYGHLTNFSVNKKSSAFDVEANKRSLTSVFAELAANGVDAVAIMAGIHRIVRLSLIAAQPVLASSYHSGISVNDGKSRCFELLGFDVFIDADAKPWLLEVNCMPSLKAASPFDRDLKMSALGDLLTVIDISGNFRAAVLKRFMEASQKSGGSSEPLFDPDQESALARETGWQQLLPVVDDPAAAKLYARALAEVRDSGQAKRVNAQPQQKNEPPKEGLLLKTVRQKKLSVLPIVCPVRQRREVRSIKLGGLVMKPSVALPLFNTFRAAEFGLRIIDGEERERVNVLRKQAQIASLVALPALINRRRVFRL
jgi:tubulin polyglutamylase TTLL6/13